MSVGSVAFERLVLPVLGPSGIAVIRLADQMLSARNDAGFNIGSAVFAGLVGIAHPQLARTAVRTAKFGLADWTPVAAGSRSGVLLVQHEVVPSDGMLRRLTPELVETLGLLGLAERARIRT